MTGSYYRRHGKASRLGIPLSAFKAVLFAAGLTLSIACAMFVTNATQSIINNKQMHYSMRLTVHLKVPSLLSVMDIDSFFG